MQIPFVGPTYNPSSLNIDAQRSINWYPEVSPVDAKTVMALLGTPGTELFCNTGVRPARGMYSFNGVMFVVVDNNLYSISTAGVMSGILGVLTTNTGRVVMKDNGLTVLGLGGNQLIIVDGVNGYIYNVITTTFSVIASPGFPANPISVDFIDGYFVVTALNSMRYNVSDLYDGLTWNALATSPVGATSDPIMTVINSHQQLWFLKQFNSEVWYDAGVATSVGSPFIRISGAVIDYGIVSPWAFVHADNSLLWLAVQRNGDASEFVGVVELSGYVPMVISPPAITYQMSLWPQYSDAFAFSYSQGGHTFCVFTSPSGNQTFVYDTTTQMWHERSVWVGAPYVIGRHMSDNYCFFNGKHYVSDYRNGNVLEMKEGVYTDYNTPLVDPLVSVRQTQHIADKKDHLNNIFIKRLTVDMEAGVGTGIIDPMAVLSWSKDGGHVWSNEYARSMGRAGEYRRRAVWKTLGYGRDRVFRLMVSDPVKRVIIGAYIN